MKTKKTLTKKDLDEAASMLIRIKMLTDRLDTSAAEIILVDLDVLKTIKGLLKSKGLI